MLKTTLHFCIASLLILQFGCQKPSAEVQVREQLPLPEYPEDGYGPFALFEKLQTRHSYAGTLLFVNPQANPADLAELIKASEFKRIAQADHQKTSEELLEKTELLNTKNAEAKEFKRVSKENARKPEIQGPKATVWVPNLLEKLIPNEEERLAALQTFETYCEAKIIEFAANRNFAENTFNSRPTPSMMCESFYEGKFFGGDLCNSRGGKNDYFKCLWKEGVLKTVWFKEKVELINRLNEWLDDGNRLFQECLKNNKSYCGGKISDAILDAKPLKMPSSVGKLPSKTGTTPNAFIFCINGYEGRKCKQKTPVNLNDYTPNELISRVELGTRTEPVFLNPSEHAEDLKLIAYYGERFGYANASENDIIFNGVTKEPAHTPDIQDDAELLQKALEGIFASRSEEDRVAYNEMVEALTPIAEQIKVLEEEEVALGVAKGDALGIANSLVYVSDLVLAYFTPVSLNVSYENDEFHFSFINGSGESVSTKNMSYEFSFYSSHLTYKRFEFLDSDGNVDFEWDPSEGRIKFGFPLDDPEAYGFSSGSEANGWFSNIATEAIADSRVEVEVWANQLNGALDILVGKFFFKNGDTVLYEGTLSMEEVPPTIPQKEKTAVAL